MDGADARVLIWCPDSVSVRQILTPNKSAPFLSAFWIFTFCGERMQPKRCITNAADVLSVMDGTVFLIPLVQFSATVLATKHTALPLRHLGLLQPETYN